jgi:predicted acylesterase/phospholipase RssA
MNNSHFEGVVLSGGGTKGILTLGALHYYYEKGTYNNNDVHAYSGTSVGTAISLLLLCGYSPMDIFMEVRNTRDLFSMQPNNTNNTNNTNNISIFDITKNMGVLSIKSFSDKIKELVINKIGYVPTLLELYSLTNKVLIATASNVSKIRAEYYKYDTHPYMSALLSTELSCCLPIIFHRMKYNEDYISDGGLTDNFPTKYVDDGVKKILAITTYYEDNEDNSDDEFIQYFYKLMFLPMKVNNELRIKSCGANVTLIKIKYAANMFESNISEEKKLNMFMAGYQTAEYKDNTEYIYVEGM